MRPGQPWADVVQVLNGWGQDWTEERLRRAVRKPVSQRMADPALLQRSPPRPYDDHLMSLIFGIGIGIGIGIAMAGPDLSLRNIAAQLERASGPRAVGRNGMPHPSSSNSLNRQGLDLLRRHPCTTRSSARQEI
jgi:hypothetical protein